MDLSWQEHGHCYGLYYEMGVDIWFAPDNPGGPKEGSGITGEKDRIRRAKKICKDCPVLRECLEYAIDQNCVGIWGGMDTQERQDFARDRRYGLTGL